MNGVKTVFLMTLMMVLFMLVGSLIGGQSGLMIAFVFSIALNFGSYWFSDKIVLTMYGAKQVNKNEAPVLYDVVERLANKSGLPVPKVYIINDETPNAFATGRNPNNAAVAATTGILRILNRDELEGVMAHELAHVKNRDILVSTITATLVGTITFIARMAGWAAMFGGRSDDREDGNAFYDLALMILAPIVAVLIQLAISRSREFGADEGGAQISGKPQALASALAKLHNMNQRIPMDANPSTAHMFIISPFAGKSLMKLFSTHPPVEERIKRLDEIARGRR
ncbi:MAG TPA: zinc metalloprotease HtpX [Melioribacteraceae bacterium]|nr:zinc metalloprotease HtpX [Melioribacteraceae bacterium]